MTEDQSPRRHKSEAETQAALPQGQAINDYDCDSHIAALKAELGLATGDPITGKPDDLDGPLILLNKLRSHYYQKNHLVQMEHIDTVIRIVKDYQAHK